MTGTILDIDGTILDSMKIWDSLGERYLHLLGKKAEMGLGRILYPMSLEESAAYLKTNYGLSQSEAEIQSGFMHIADQFYREEVQPVPGAVEFVRALAKREIPVIAATTGDPDQLRAAFVRLGIDGELSGIVTCLELHTTKRETLIYREAARRLGARPEETWVFEDMEIGVRSAKAAGCHVCAVTGVSSEAESGKAGMSEIADLTVPDFMDRERIFHAMGLKLQP